MKIRMLPILLLLALMVSACSTPEEQSNSDQVSNEKMVTYQSEEGPVKVPAAPQRVVLLSAFPSAGHVLALGVNVVGVSQWDKGESLFQEDLQNATVVSDESLEKIIELNPDLIIGFSQIKNKDKLKNIAPTVTFTHGKVDYLSQILEIGKLVNKEQEAKQWIETFEKKAADIGEKVRKKIGQDATVSVIQSEGKQHYLYGDNFGRGTEILYQAMKLKMPEKVKMDVKEEGFKTIASEVIPTYVGDYLVLCKEPGAKHPFQETETYKNIPAVKNGQVIEVDAGKFDTNDPISLDYQLEVFEKAFLGE